MGAIGTSIFLTKENEMSLYNMLFGTNPNSDQLLGLLGKTKGDFGRFRDVFVEDGHIVVHTRNGGGNREDYEDVFDEMSEHPWYVRDADDDFDCTYANIYFKIPEDAAKTYVALLEQGHNPAESWNKILELIK
jgi:hypothetical protein